MKQCGEDRNWGLGPAEGRRSCYSRGRVRWYWPGALRSQAAGGQ